MMMTTTTMVTTKMMMAAARTGMPMSSSKTVDPSGGGEWL
jgi:hypothetical protein